MQRFYGIFNENFPPVIDGVAVTVQNYARWLYEKKYGVCVVTPFMPSLNEKEFGYEILQYLSVPIPMRKPYRLGLPDLDPKFQAKILATPFDLVHAHCPFSSGQIALKIAKKRNIPLVATFHSKYKMDFTRAIPSKRIVNNMITNVIDFYNRADEVWIPQAAVEETLREYGYRGRVEVMENGNDFTGNDSPDLLRIEMREKLRISGDETMFLFVGQHILEKNVILILDALALLKELPFKMFFIGTGYAEEEMKRKSEELGLSGKVVFEGSIKNREVLKSYFAAADLFLFPSLYDNAPLVVREAAAMQTPSLLLKNSTASEIITDGLNGFLSPDTPAGFAGKIREISAQSALFQMVGKIASLTISRSWENVVEEVADRYNSLVKRRGC
ncbi:MAG: glycosyltransferase [Dysgonamonadaceae bacterium]|jgi:glycosyltransferase involved in cell wall biosynthesis|nr:glycosyltransferase [Dysgonamonadaceae bacterium]